MSGQQKEVFNTKLWFKKKMYLEYAHIELFETEKNLKKQVLYSFFLAFLKASIFSSIPL